MLGLLLVLCCCCCCFCGCTRCANCSCLLWYDSLTLTQPQKGERRTAAKCSLMTVHYYDFPDTDLILLHVVVHCEHKITCGPQMKSAGCKTSRNFAAFHRTRLSCDVRSRPNIRTAATGGSPPDISYSSTRTLCHVVIVQR